MPPTHSAKLNRIHAELERAGEIIVHLRNGRSYELHQHDTELHEEYVRIDHDEESYEFFYGEVVDIEVHESGPLN